MFIASVMSVVPSHQRIPVLFIANWPNVIKGGQVNLIRLIERIDRQRFLPVVAVSREGSLSQRARQINVAVEVLPLTRMEVYRPDAYLTNILPTMRLKRLIRTHDIRLIYVDSPGHLLPAWLASRGTEARVVWHAQTSARTQLDGLFVRLADHIICCSHAAEDRFAPRSVQLFMVPNCVICDQFAPKNDQPSAPGTAERGETVLLYLGELASSKGLPELLHVFSLVCKQTEDKITLWIAGKGTWWMEKWLRARARQLGIADRVRWLGYASDPLALLRAADIFVFFSHSEGLSLALLEAMATGLPIVASNIPSNVEALAEAGITVSLKDPSQAAEILLSLIHDTPRRLTLGRAARARATEQFPIQRFVSGVEELFELWGALPAGGE